MLARAAPLLLAGMLLLITRASAADASHPFQGSGQYGNINYLYRNLEVPGGIITYSLCGTPYGNPPPEWRNGIERWDDAIARWQFNEASQCSSANTLVKWETAGDSCDDDDDPGEVNLAWACWERGGSIPGHGSHLDLVYDPFNRTRIKVDYKDWNAFTNQAWRDYIPAHEWGHSMSLADHSGTKDCGTGTIMLNYVNVPLPSRAVPATSRPPPTTLTP